METNIQSSVNPPPAEHERLAAMMDAVPTLVSYVDSECVYQYVNLAYERWFGCRREEILGRPVWEIVGQDAWQKVRPRVLRALNGEQVRFEDSIPYKDAGMRWVSVTYTPDRRPDGIIPGMVALILDVSEQKEAEAAWRREHIFSYTLLRTTAALVVVLDTQGRIVHFNRAFEQATGYSSSDVLGSDFFSLFLPSEERGSVRGVFRNLLNMPALGSRHVNFIQSRDGRRRLVEWSNSVIYNDAGNVEYVIGTGLDITERRELEQALISISEGERQRLGQELHDGLGQKLTALELFVCSMKEEARKLSPGLADRCDDLGRELRETARMARSLSHGLAHVPFATDGLLLALADLAESTSFMTGTRVRFVNDPEVKVESPGTAMHLYRIAQEAVNNALKHARPTHIEIRLFARAGKCELSIVDDGSGIASSINNEAGMGLKLMRHRAELMGAHLEVTSVPGIGTTVTCEVGEPL